MWTIIMSFGKDGWSEVAFDNAEDALQFISNNCGGGKNFSLSKGEVS